MVNLRKELEKCKHPNSRKTKALSKKVRRQTNKHKARFGHAVKSNLIGQKLTWFMEQLDEDRTTPLTPVEFEQLIELYLRRFDEELEQIALKQSISKSRNNQHVARQDVIKMTVERETSQFNSGGIELLNLCDPVKFKVLKDWDGNGLSVQHLKMDLVSKNLLQRLKEKHPNENNEIIDVSTSAQVESMDS